jgi:hypothetical protein
MNHDSNPRGFRASEKVHRTSIDKCDVRQIESDAIVCFGREQLL